MLDTSQRVFPVTNAPWEFKPATSLSSVAASVHCLDGFATEPIDGAEFGQSDFLGRSAPATFDYSRHRARRAKKLIHQTATKKHCRGTLYHQQSRQLELQERPVMNKTWNKFLRSSPPRQVRFQPVDSFLSRLLICVSARLKCMVKLVMRFVKYRDFVFNSTI